MPQQFENPANMEIHSSATAAEILRDFPEGIDLLITGVGTGGHITGVSESAQGALAEPQDVRGGAGEIGRHQRRQPSPHQIQGISAGFVPANLHTDTLDGMIQVSEEDAYEFASAVPARRASSSACRRVPRSLRSRRSSPTSRRRTVLTFCYDTGERYFSVEGLFAADGTSVRVAARP